MRRQEDLQVRLRERHRRLLVAEHHAYLPTLRLVRDWIQSDAVLRALIEEAKRAEPHLDADAWTNDLAGHGAQHGGAVWPHTSEGGQAALIWRLVQRLADGEIEEQVLWMLSSHRNINDALRDATENLISPLFDYLVERVGDQSSVLHTLERYVRLVEWFDRQVLIEAFDAEPSRGEEVFNEHLRRFLFTEGIDMPYTEAQSPSGESDALAALHTDEPLVCEIKVFDGVRRNKRHVATGLHQALLYAQDYGKTEAYLVVMNVSGRPLEIEGDNDAKTWPPYVDVAGVRVYIVGVRARRLASASKSGPATTVKIARADLTDPDGDEDDEE